jgi:hypothetical protein
MSSFMLPCFQTASSMLLLFCNQNGICIFHQWRVYCF